MRCRSNWRFVSFGWIRVRWSMTPRATKTMSATGVEREKTSSNPGRSAGRRSSSSAIAKAAWKRSWRSMSAGTERLGIVITMSILAEAEKLVPVTDLTAAKQAFRDIAERWDAAGKVPRDRMKELEGRIRKVEQAIRGVEDDQWKRSNPEARARAADTVAQLESSLEELEAKRAKAEAAGNAEFATGVEAVIDHRVEIRFQRPRAIIAGNKPQ